MAISKKVSPITAKRALPSSVLFNSLLLLVVQFQIKTLQQFLTIVLPEHCHFASNPD